jgi:cyclohexanone monooxygenase
MNRLLSVIRRLNLKIHNRSKDIEQDMAKDSQLPSTQKAEPEVVAPKAAEAQPVQTEELGFSPEEVQARYAAERQKRLRTDGVEQYIDVEGIFKHYTDDPYVSGPSTRAPISEDVGTLVIGAGYGGLCTAVRLVEQGVNDIRIVEKAGGWGGTWYWNRYPGAACDVESYIYMPLVEEMGTMPTEKYAKGPELLAHAENIAKRWDLNRRALFQTEIKAMKWNDDLKRWIVITDRGDELRARYVVTASGVLHKPKLPGLPGIASYKGHSFHTSRWDYSYTGGSTTDPNLLNLADKRVAIVGTGATAVQVVPHLGKHAKEVYVYQRTPSSVGVRGNKPTDPDWFKTLKPGWQRERRENFQTIITGGYQEVDLVDDGWTEILKYLSFPGGEHSSAMTADNTKIADLKMMNKIRSRVDSVVQDPATAEKLKPWYGQMCKRPCFHDEYLQTFNRPNVHLVDTNGQGVERVTENGLVANGVEQPIDLIIWSTGFDLASDFSKKNGIEITGKSQTLTEKWSDGLSTLHGIHSRGFPNAFIIGPSQAAASTNFVHSIDVQAQQIAYIISTCEKKRVISIEPTQEAEDAWVAGIVAAAPYVTEALKDCTPGYYNNEGKASPKGAKMGTFPGGMTGYLAVFDEYRKGDKLPGMEIKTEVETQTKLDSAQKADYAHHPLENQELRATI